MITKEEKAIRAKIKRNEKKIVEYQYQIHILYKKAIRMFLSVVLNDPKKDDI